MVAIMRIVIQPSPFQIDLRQAYIDAIIARRLRITEYKQSTFLSRCSFVFPSTREPQSGQTQRKEASCQATN